MNNKHQLAYDFLIGIYKGKKAVRSYAGICHNIESFCYEKEIDISMAKFKVLLILWQENHNKDDSFPVLDDSYECCDGVRYDYRDNHYTGAHGCARRRLAKYLADNVEEFIL